MEIEGKISRKRLTTSEFPHRVLQKNHPIEIIQLTTPQNEKRIVILLNNDLEAAYGQANCMPSTVSRLEQCFSCAARRNA